MDLQKLLDSLTLEEKLGQLTQVNAEFFNEKSQAEVTGPQSNLGVTKEQVATFGSTLNFKGAKEAIDIANSYLEKSKNKIPLMFMMDVIHGFRTIYPINLGMACAFDDDLVQRCSAMAAKEGVAGGVNVNFSPMVDLVRDARWGRVMESAGEDPYLACAYSKAQVKGFQGDMGKDNFAACVKHFAVYGAPEAGRDYNTVDMSERTMREYYLPTYKAAVDAGVRMVMSSFNSLNGQPAAGNEWLCKQVLRNEWGFDGVLISDYNSFREMLNHGYAESEKKAANLALNATNDIEMMSATYVHHVKELLDEGKIDIKQVDEAVMRVLKLKDELGLFENPLRGASEEEENRVFLCPAHRALAREAAEKSAVLLKNDGVLPFNLDAKKVAVIGDYAVSGDIIGFWHCEGRPEEAVTLYDGIERLLPDAKVKYAKGCSIALDATDESGIKEAVKVAKKADAVIVAMGEPGGDSGEGNSKANLEIPEIQYKLLQAVLKVNQNVAVVLFSGRPLAIEKLNDIAPAILQVWQPGTEGGSACANLLFGRAVPQGKLAMTFPRTTGQCPIYYNHYNTGRPRTNDRRRVAYQSSYIDTPNTPLYPFGYGLSYTTFAYSDVTLDKTEMDETGSITASVTVKNTGRHEGTETVQLYLRDLAGECVRPVKELKGYKKVTLKAGEEQAVSFEIKIDDLKYYHSDLTYRADKGEFTLFIGSSSAVDKGVNFTLK